MTSAPDLSRFRLPPGPATLATLSPPWQNSGASGSIWPATRDHSWNGGRATESRGAIAAEFAVTLPAVLLLLAMLLAGAAAGATQLRLEEGARAGARALARGDDFATVQGIVRTLSGASASAVVEAEGEWLNVTVTDRVGGPLGASFPWTLTARASSRSETATAGPRGTHPLGTGAGAGGQAPVELALQAGKAS